MKITLVELIFGVKIGMALIGATVFALYGIHLWNILVLLGISFSLDPFLLWIGPKMGCPHSLPYHKTF